MEGTRDYQAWHRGYDDPDSGLSWRLREVRRHLTRALDEHPGETRVVSVCAGDGRDVLGVLSERDDADRVEAHLIELHPLLARQARDVAAAAGLSRVQVHTVDASQADVYRDVAPVDLVLLVGIFGNIADSDVWRLIRFSPQLCRPGAVVIWSRGRRFGRELPGVTLGDLNDEVRAGFAAAGFTEVVYETHDGAGLPAIGVARYDGPSVELQPEQLPLFTFLR